MSSVQNESKLAVRLVKKGTLTVSFTLRFHLRLRRVLGSIGDEGDKRPGHPENITSRTEFSRSTGLKMQQKRALFLSWCTAVL